MVGAVQYEALRAITGFLGTELFPCFALPAALEP
jgi:hypothetical protein